MVTVIAPGVRVEGTVITSAPLRVDGHVDGEIKAKGELSVGESGRVEGPIHGVSIRVAGEVEGDVDASNQIRILPTGRLIGNVQTPNLIIEEGALFKGQCEMTSRADETEASKKSVESDMVQRAESDVAQRGESDTEVKRELSSDPPSTVFSNDRPTGPSIHNRLKRNENV